MKENIISGTIAVAGTTASMYLGGWDTVLKVLIFFMIADYATGVAGAIKTKSLNSEVMFWGGVRKAVVLVVVAMAVMLDQLVGNDTPIFRTMALYFYIAREGISIMENFGVLGVYVPSWMRKVLQQIEDKGGDGK